MSPSTYRATVVAMITLVALAGCSAQNSPSGQDGPSGGASTGGAEAAGPTSDGQTADMTLTVWTADETIIATYEELADAFREDNPGLGDFTVQSIPFDDYTSQLAIRLQGGEAPDLAWIVEANAPAFIDSGALADLQPLADDEAFGQDDYLPNLLEPVTRDEALYGIPFANTAQPIFYNTAAFEAAGVDTPLELLERDEWTWESLRRISQEMVQSGQVTYGFDIPQFNLTNYQFMNVFLKGFGAEAFPSGTECGYTSPESVEAFTFLHEMIFTDDSYPGPGEITSFPSGDTAVILAAPSTLNQITDPALEVETVPQPTGVEGRDYFLGQAFMTVLQEGQNPELATRLLAFLTSEDASRELAAYYVSGRQELLTADVVAGANDRISAEGAERGLIEPLTEARQVTYPTAYPEIAAALTPAFDAVWTPDADIESGLAAVCELADPILAGQ